MNRFWAPYHVAFILVIIPISTAISAELSFPAYIKMENLAKNMNNMRFTEEISIYRSDRNHKRIKMGIGKDILCEPHPGVRAEYGVLYDLEKPLSDNFECDYTYSSGMREIISGNYQSSASYSGGILELNGKFSLNTKHYLKYKDFNSVQEKVGTINETYNETQYLKIRLGNDNLCQILLLNINSEEVSTSDKPAITIKSYISALPNTKCTWEP